MDEPIVYPQIVAVTNGYQVNMNSRVSLPGYFTSYNQAERAIGRYVGKMKQVQQDKKGK